jgi:hypothetical protein
VYESAQGFCLAGILVGARVPALLGVAVLFAAAVMAIIFTPSVNFSEVPFPIQPLLQRPALSLR